MKKALATCLLLASHAALAHPGHGEPGWFHLHALDIALVVLGLASLSACIMALAKRRARP